MPDRPARSVAPRRLAGWLARWGAVLPLLVAEFILWTGFGALLPVMPLYFVEHGVDIALLGVVIAAWPAARLVAEPIFGALADRTARVPLMVLGLLIAGGAIGAMAIWTAPIAFIAFRALSGLGTAIYDPAARGYLTDSAPEGRRGEVFGLYNAAQMGGLLLGPAIGGLGAALAGGYTFVLVFCAISTAVAALAVALRVPELHGRHRPSIPATSLAEFPAEASSELGKAELNKADVGVNAGAPPSLRNRFIAAAIIVNVAAYFGGGLYETIWSLFVTDRGGGVELVGLTFAVFGLTTIVASPLGGRMVDRHGPLPFVVFGLLTMAAMMVGYPFVSEPLVFIPMVAIEAVGFAFLGPATYVVIARGTPPGKSSTAQGFLGSAGTIGTITAALSTGVMASINLSIPFFVGAAIVTLLLGLTLLVGGRALMAARPAFVRSGVPD